MTTDWLHAYNFNSYAGIFLGHRGCARISDTQKRYPYLVEVRQDPEKPRMYIYRLKWESLDEAMNKLKDDDVEAYNFVKEQLKKKSITWKEYRMVARETPDRTIVMERQLVIV